MYSCCYFFFFLFFFFKQKTAYEIMPSLVGSEMCIRDRFHSDRGAQYTSTQFAAHLSKHNMVGSMGRTGICWDNAMAESFFAALKNELIYRTAFPTRESARR